VNIWHCSTESDIIRLYRRDKSIQSKLLFDKRIHIESNKNKWKFSKVIDQNRKTEEWKHSPKENIPKNPQRIYY
jgi:hypothetical protein